MLPLAEAGSSLLPLCGVVLANAKCLSPLSAVLRVRTLGTLGSLNPLPLVAVTANNAGWTAYTLTGSHDPYVLAGTVPGLILGLFYVASTYRAASATDEQHQIVCATGAYALTLGTAALLSSMPMLHMTMSDAFGDLSTMLLLSFYVSPVPAMLDAMRQKSAAKLHAPLAATTLVNAGLWMAYGWHSNDWHMYAPQFVGAVVAAVQLSLCAVLSSEAALASSSATELKSLFDTLDKNGDGRVTGQEWGSAVSKNQDVMSKFFGGSSVSAVGRAFRRIDADGSGDLTWEEFVAGSSLRAVAA